MACRLTLICPSLERHHYLQRSCRFWVDRDDVCVLYADGSQFDLDLSHLNASNLRYSHRPTSFQERLLWLIEQVETPYICVLSDDEFYLPSALKLCVDFLDNHPEYVSCMGRAIGFSRLNDKIVLSQQYPRLRDRDLSDSGAFNRLETHFSSYVPSHFYAVTRTGVFLSAIKAAFEIELDVYAIFELSTELLIVAAGKSIVLPSLYWLRSHEAPPLRNTGDLALDPSKRFVHWWRNIELEEQKKNFCKHLSVASSNVLDEDNVRDIFDCYIDSAYGQTTIIEHALLRRFKRILLVPVKKFLRFLVVLRVVLANKVIGPAARSKAALQELCDQGVSIDQDGLAECLTSIEESWGP